MQAVKIESKARMINADLRQNKRLRKLMEMWLNQVEA